MAPHRLKYLQKILAIAIAGLVLYSCANIVAPTGGPRDEDPPVVLSSNPQNFSPNFSGNQFRIFFDEFVQLEDINQKLMVSPPFEKQPEVRLRGRSVMVRFDEALRENTTYNFFFGDAIVDNNEGNAIPNFQFVFSTGPYVDSLSIDGRVTDAFSRKPVAGVYVMLYDNFNDSVPYLERPVYLAKTDKEGYFGISNIREGKYKIFGLEDLNANFRFDLPNERIAFTDSVIIPRYVEPKPAEEEPAQAEAPPVTPVPRPRPGEPPAARAARPGMNQRPGVPGMAEPPPVAAPPRDVMFQLSLFQQADTIQRVISSSLIKAGQVQMIFRIPADSVSLRDLSGQLPENQMLPEMVASRDTLLLWLLPPTADTLKLEVADRGLVIDTIQLSSRPREVRGRGQAPEAGPKLSLRLNAGPGAALPFFEPLTILAGNPTQRVDTTAIHIMTADSVLVEPVFGFSYPVMRRLQLKTPLDQQKGYIIQILPGAFTDIFGNTNDTLKTNFSTNRFEDYGKIILILGLESGQGQFILQLTDKDGKTLQENITEGGGTFEFNHLLPGNYGLRLIHDLNLNGTWDTGHYLHKIQPEPVYVYDGVLQVRQNWESEMNWDVNL